MTGTVMIPVTERGRKKGNKGLGMASGKTASLGAGVFLVVG